MHHIFRQKTDFVASMEFEPDVSLPELSGYTVLVPCVSVGNVGQLAVDVLLATLQPALVSQV